MSNFSSFSNVRLSMTLQASLIEWRMNNII